MQIEKKLLHTNRCETRIKGVRRGGEEEEEQRIRKALTRSFRSFISFDKIF